MSRLSESSEVGLIVTSRRSSAKESSSATILPHAGHPTKGTLFSFILEGLLMRYDMRRSIATPLLHFYQATLLRSSGEYRVRLQGLGD
jgi:hypothetical protein